MEKDNKKSEEILKLSLLDQAKRVQKSVRGFYNQVAIYYIIVLLAIFEIWYIDDYFVSSMVICDGFCWS